MFVENYLYFEKSFGYAYNNTQIRVGLDSSGNIRSFIQLEWDMDNDKPYPPVTSEQGLDMFLRTMIQDKTWFIPSNAEKFCKLALYSEPISFVQQFETGKRLPS